MAIGEEVPMPVDESPNKLLAACGVLVFVYALSIGVIYSSSKIGPIEAQVEGSIKKLGGSIWIAAGGLVGVFLAISLVGFGAVYIFSGRR